jgi:hypothetical protein
MYNTSSHKNNLVKINAFRPSSQISTPDNDLWMKANLA